MPPATRVLGYVVAGCAAGMGTAVLLGFLKAPAPAPVRTICGVILVLLGVNRFLVTRMKDRQNRRRHFDDGRRH